MKLRVPVLETERLKLRAIEGRDLDCFFEMCSDPAVMEFFPSVMTKDETKVMMERMIARAQLNGFCFEMVEDKVSGEPYGFVGLNIPHYQDELHFGPCVEIGWRLKRSCWGQGIAVEAAKAWLGYGFNELELDEIVALTAKGNLKSQRVMSKLGMSYNQEDDFLHPLVEKDHPLAEQVLYRLNTSSWTS
ncbi:GNAT family N-acetyltransferase [Polycladidibacter stylochi]|uniref:GNAT family N-acetyltransferase n=1 Tax=Polycladidibacter stylochi TaxID=1807766 RepID=UPI00083094B5|nr:GNAT family N-acetyltransferase [Pseudovibrio stylochi]